MVMTDEKASVVHFVNVECQMSNVGCAVTDVNMVSIRSHLYASHMRCGLKV